MSVAMFSLVDAALLRPLPFAEQESIYVIWKADPLAGDCVTELAYPGLIDLQESIRGFEQVPCSQHPCTDTPGSFRRQPQSWCIWKAGRSRTNSSAFWVCLPHLAVTSMETTNESGRLRS